VRDQRRWGGPDPPADLFSMHLIGEPYAPLADILTRMVTGHLVNRLDKCCRGRGRPKPRSPMLNVQPPNGYHPAFHRPLLPHSASDFTPRRLLSERHRT